MWCQCEFGDALRTPLTTYDTLTHICEAAVCAGAMCLFGHAISIMLACEICVTAHETCRTLVFTQSKTHFPINEIAPTIERPNERNFDVLLNFRTASFRNNVDDYTITRIFI